MIATSHIEVTPGVCGGKPRIAGHRIRVQDVAVCYESLAMNADDIVARYPQLSLADVHAALAYYFDHHDEIRQDIRDGKALAEAVRTGLGSKLVEKLTAGDGGGHSVPSR